MEISADGVGGWIPVETVGPSGPESAGGWFHHSFRVLDFVPLTANVRLRFVAEDAGGDSVVEAAIDDLSVQPFCCQGAASCTDGLFCTLEICEVSGRCGYEIAAGSCSIAEGCYLDGELNPADDCEVCDAAIPGAWSPALPSEVAGLVVGQGPTLLAWVAQTGAVYDVVGGAIDELAADGGVQGALCLAQSIPIESWADPRPDPAPSQGFYYLVRSAKSCGAGTYGVGSAGSPRLPTSDCP